MLDTHTDTKLKNTLLRRNMDKMIDRNMIEYDRLLQEKLEQGESKRFTESRKRRRELEEIDKSVRAQQERAMAEIRYKETEIERNANEEQMREWQVKQAQAREQLMQSRRLVKTELDRQVHGHHVKREE